MLLRGVKQAAVIKLQANCADIIRKQAAASKTRHVTKIQRIRVNANGEKFQEFSP